ncbi:cell wall biogenesis protein Mhp1 [Hirsutella rhossiliensis]|uniref:Cell wall biogenesis protein Mhp1 n=1 Tax=Hirsutella rhossiliensis TaxID=111463 RepID=A0A9P8MZM1_9HYPO|nr:cell wall biogenesis protein Mhp1 [Hirsutella rhossiliensis]KAH0964217.1 cell wall biogenesis protein Mhp1 [Hirsutella rhossiliensis]
MPVYADAKTAQKPKNLMVNDVGEAPEGPGVVQGTDGSLSEPAKYDKDIIYRREKREERRKRHRRVAEEHGLVPVEVYNNISNSSTENHGYTGTPQAGNTTSRPITDAVRIYRRCCKLRETSILKKITAQLTNGANLCPTTGAVKRLDLTDCWLQLPDIVTLGDYLAIFPVTEIVLENCGLSDEGLRIILAGLLAVKRSPGSWCEKRKQTPEVQGVVERVVLKKNKLGLDGWRYISLFLYLCRSLEHLDISQITPPKQTARNTCSTLHPSNRFSLGITDVFSRAIAQRPEDRP